MKFQYLISAILLAKYGICNDLNAEDNDSGSIQNSSSEDINPAKVDTSILKIYKFTNEHQDILNDFANGKDIQLLYFKEEPEKDMKCPLSESKIYKLPLLSKPGALKANSETSKGNETNVEKKANTSGSSYQIASYFIIFISHFLFLYFL